VVVADLGLIEVVVMRALLGTEFEIGAVAVVGFTPGMFDTTVLGTVPTLGIEFEIGTMVVATIGDVEEVEVVAEVVTIRVSFKLLHPLVGIGRTATSFIARSNFC
jgi:hypothetical protein